MASFVMAAVFVVVIVALRAVFSSTICFLDSRLLLLGDVVEFLRKHLMLPPIGLISKDLARIYVHMYRLYCFP